MIKIGTLTCLHSNNVCARVGCLKAFQNRSDFFEGYSPDTLLGAMMTCNGCKSANPKEPDVDEGILEKIDRLVSEELKVMYVGGCRLYGKKNECSRIPVSVKRWKIEAFRWLEAPIENEKIRRI